MMTSASGVGSSIMVIPDASVSGAITTAGVEGVMAPIHEAQLQSLK